MREHALAAARAAAAALTAPDHEWIGYAPGDCVLLVGPTDLLRTRLDMARAAGLRAALLCTDLLDPSRLPAGTRTLPGRLATLSGWMGEFRASIQVGDLAPLSWHEDGHFDWVLDFSGFLARAVPPPGYYALAPEDYPAFKRALLEIVSRRRDGFEKPRYFAFDANLCAHRRQGITGCDNCLAVCPAGAIVSDKGSVRIEAYLCQGCGTCALVCPSGAARHVVPDTAFEMKRTRAMLAAWRAAEGGPVGLWISDRAEDIAPPSGWLNLRRAQPAGLGAEFWLAALTSGAERVAIDASNLDSATRSAMQGQLSLVLALLEALGLPGAIGLADGPTSLAAIPPMTAPPRTDDAVPNYDKRALLFAALDHLAMHAANTRVAVSLPAAAPLGEARIAAAACTLCGACVRVCPSQALSFPGNTRQIAFTEQACLQCGLCRAACPEDALSLAPRLLMSPVARRTPRVLVEAEMFSCTICGTPFAPRAMIERARALMADHPMFQGEQAHLMTLCPDCRQRHMAGSA
jgi:ferredoxin